jgi:hypothetical protein
MAHRTLRRYSRPSDLKGGGRARDICCLCRFANCRSDRDGICCRKKPAAAAGADLHHDRLHDQLQRDRRDLSGGLRGARFAAERRRDQRQQRHRERVVPDELLDAAAQLSDQLRPDLAVTVSESDRALSASRRSFR